jgi:prolyl-tRNA synthetase
LGSIKQNIKVIYDDRNVSAGVMFPDADLLGIPVRVTASPRNMKENCVEIATRDKKVSMKVPLDKAVETVIDLVNKLKAEA